jgi:small-conductance mechanosensitive channel
MDLRATIWSAVTDNLDILVRALLAIAIVGLAVAIAIVVYGVLLRVGRRIVAGQPLLQAIYDHTRAPLRFFVVILAVRLAVPVAPLAPDVAGVIGRALQVALVVFIGWVALVSANIAADIYLRRFKIDVEDNYLARKHVTQVRILKGALDTLIILITVAAALMTFETVRQYGVSLFASAGIAGVVVGLAARPLLSNLIAGVQIAVTQPIRIDDAVVIEGEWGWIEEITATYVVVKLWDWRRLIVPLSYFMEKPFQNWTRRTASIIGSVVIHADYTVPVARLREKLSEIVKASKLWDGQVVNLQVTDARERTIELRALVSARTSPAAWELRCEVREKLIAFLQQDHPETLPRARIEAEVTPSQDAKPIPAKPDAATRDA